MEMNGTMIEKKYGDLWVILPDAITMYNSCEIEALVRRNLTDQTKRVVLNLEKTVNLFSSGLGLMIRLKKEITAKGGTLSLVNVSRSIRDLFEGFNLEKVFSIFTTDIEFEISHEDIWDQRSMELKMGFIFVAQIENGIYHINISGEMIVQHDMTECERFRLSPEIQVYIFDLSSLEILDAHGLAVFNELTYKVCAAGAQCRCFGASDMVRETLGLFGTDRFVTFYPDEKSAIEDKGRLP